MSGYWTSYGYIGFVDGEKRLFASDTEYYEYLEELAWKKSMEKLSTTGREFPMEKA